MKGPSATRNDQLDAEIVKRCDAGDGDSCEIIIVVQGMAGGACGDDCQRAQTLAAFHACKVGSLPICELIAHQALASCDAADTTCPADAPAEVTDAIAKTRTACSDGDADACSALPGRALPATDLCAAHDYAHCQK
jgi:hypothetical protein